MSEVKAIPTVYKGIEFRSRLEARWAVFFDACGVDWEYEPEGFELSNGIRYLPDFLLHNVNGCEDLWVEIKGKLTEEDLHKVELFFEDGFDDCLSQYTRSIIILGSIPQGKDFHDLWNQHFENNENKYLFDFTYSNRHYPDTVFLGLENEGSFSLFTCFERRYCNDQTYLAYQKALSAKFEYGQTPNSNPVDINKYKEKLEELLEEIQEALDVL